MRFPRPKSLSGLMLTGFTIVAAPLLFAIMNAAVQINHLSARSEQLVLHGVRGTRNNQRMFEEIGALERTARLYQIIGSADLLEVYARTQERLVATLNELLAMPLDAGSHDDAVALQAEADRLAQEKNRFLRHMSHELKTPLANIREGTELLMDGAVGELQSSQREVTAILRENGMKLQRLIENLLSFSAWQAKSVGLEVTEFKLRPLVKSVLENQQLTLVAQRVRLDVHIEDLAPLADRGKVRLILDNLLSNAIKFTPRGGTISIHARAEREQLVMDVIDSGPGIPAEERNRIFEAFYQGKTPQGGHVKGTGIGLSVVTEFVNAHSGSIEILEAKAGGAHFRVRLPMRQAAKPREKAHAA